jgi:hypothetical protein
MIAPDQQQWFNWTSPVRQVEKARTISIRRPAAGLAAGVVVTVVSSWLIGVAAVTGSK